MIGLAKDGSLHARRQALGFVYDADLVKSLFEQVGPWALGSRPATAAGAGSVRWRRWRRVAREAAQWRLFCRHRPAMLPAGWVRWVAAAAIRGSTVRGWLSLKTIPPAPQAPARYADRNGGYCRVKAEIQPRRGDNTEMATIELV